MPHRLRTPPPVPGERALTLLYEAELKGETPVEVLAALPAAPDPNVTALVTAVGEHRERIDELISSGGDRRTSTAWPWSTGTCCAWPSPSC